MRLWVGNCNPRILLVKFSISITTTKLWDSNYSEYQEYLYNRICEYKDKSVTLIGYILYRGQFFLPMENDVVLTDTPSERLWK